MKTLFNSFLLFILFSFAVLSQTNVGIVKGRVLDSRTGKPIGGAQVYLADKSQKYNTDNTGSFFIENVLVGDYTLVIISADYCMETVAVKIDSTFPVSNNDIPLIRARIPLIVPDSLKEYHQLISKLDPKEILEIKIDSISTDAEFIDITIKNISSIPVYIIEDLPCFRLIGVTIRDEYDKVVHQNIFDLGCDVSGIELPKINNLRRLEPNESIRQFNIRTWYVLSNKEKYKGKYFITAIYEIKEFEYLPGQWGCPGDLNYDSYKDEKYVLNRATRGRYESINPIVFVNSESDN